MSYKKMPQYLTERAILFLEKSSGLSWNYPDGRRRKRLVKKNKLMIIIQNDTILQCQHIIIALLKDLMQMQKEKQINCWPAAKQIA